MIAALLEKIAIPVLPSVSHLILLRGWKDLKKELKKK